MTIAITLVAVILCCVRYFLCKRAILLTNIALALVAIYDLLRLVGPFNAGIYFSLLAILGSALQIFGMNLPLLARWGISLVISVIAVYFMGDAAAPLLLMSFVMARFAEGSNNVVIFRLCMMVTHLLTAQYAIMYDSMLILATQLIQITMILIVFGLEWRARRQLPAT